MAGRTRGAPAGPAPTAERLSGARPRRTQWVRDEVLLALELTALASFAFSRPVLDSFGRSPETFIARGSSAWTLVQFGLVVALVPASVVVAVGLASRPLGRAVRRWVHVVLVAAVGGVAAWRLGQDVTGRSGTAVPLVVGAVVGGLVVAVARRRLAPVRTFLRLTSVAAVVFLAQFLLTSPSAELMLGHGSALDGATGEWAAAGDEPPSIVVLVFDGLPTMSLLDGEGRIDAALYPRFAELATTSTWYRNNSTVSAFTASAVPAILTGRLPLPGVSDDPPPPDPENLFTLLGGSYEIHGAEPTTRLCPGDLCPVEHTGGLGRLLGDAVSSWTARTTLDDADRRLQLPGAFDPERFQDTTRWIEEQDFRRGERPKLFFYHALLPHFPYELAPDGSLYEQVGDRAPFIPPDWPASGAGLTVARQRNLLQLQAVDRLVGQVMDELRAAGTFDDTLLVVTADHGEAFTAGEPTRNLTARNFAEIAWVPLIVKEPGQTVGDVNDDNAMVIDLVPTIAANLGIKLPWPVDGIPLSRVAERDPTTKPFQDNEGHELRPEEGDGRLHMDARRGLADVLAADAAEGEGADAIWQRTRYGELFGHDVADLAAGSPVDGAVDVERLADIEAHDAGEPPLLEVLGYTNVDEGTIVAYALNGAIAALTEVESSERQGGQVAHGLLPPDLVVDGRNELTAHVVEGQPGDETLRPLTLR